MSATVQDLAIKLNFDPAALDRSRATAAAELAGLAEVQIRSDEDAAIVSAYLAERLREADAVEEMRKEATQPIDKALRAIRSWFKPTLDTYQAIEDTLKAKLMAWERQKINRRQAALAVATQAVQARDIPTMTAALAVVSAPAVKPEGMSTVRTWRATVVDEMALTREWLCPNMAKIGAHASNTPVDQTPAPIPGVAFELEIGIRQRR